MASEVGAFRCHWQVHWAGSHDIHPGDLSGGSGPLRASGYGDSPESAWAALLADLDARHPGWSEAMAEHTAAVNEVEAIRAS